MSDKKETLIDYDDLCLIISNAKSNYVNMTLPVTLGRSIKGKNTYTEVQPNDAAHVAMIESVISFLNGQGVLTNAVKMDLKKR